MLGLSSLTDVLMIILGLWLFLGCDYGAAHNYSRVNSQGFVCRICSGWANGKGKEKKIEINEGVCSAG